MPGALCRKSLALRGIAEREKWTDLRTQAQHTADTKLVKSIGGTKGKLTVKINDVADKLLDKINNTLELMDVVDSQSIKHFTSALKDIRDIKGIKSDIDLKEQEARIAKLQKEAEADTDKNSSVSITIEGGDDEWQN